ncbi:hypothetical protein IMSAG249_01469 [Lachnospiraceae bacterium]|nr:hypothetical protein IMSAGC009_01857 [Lachnospiraceae bacterium]GFI69644.1 hypothetical protein IMSAG249_01469 [Lachnospiraceae bacterium]
MKKLLAKYCTMNNIAILIMMLCFTSFTLAPLALANGSSIAHDNRIEDLQNHLLEAENKEEAAVINTLIRMENNKWEETQASPSYHFWHLFYPWCFEILAVSGILFPSCLDYISR